LTGRVVRLQNVPSSIAVNPTPHLIYVANYDSNTVSVIDGENYIIHRNIKVGNNPTSIVVNPTTHLIYVANSGSNTVSIIDSNTNTVTKTIIIGLFVDKVSINPNINKVYIASAFGERINVLDADTNRTSVVYSNNTLGHSWEAMTINDLNNNVYLASDNSISILDGITNRVRSVLPASNLDTNYRNIATAINTNTNKLYVLKVERYTADGVVSVLNGTRSTILPNYVSQGKSLGEGIHVDIYHSR